MICVNNKPNCLGMSIQFYWVANECAKWRTQNLTIRINLLLRMIKNLKILIIQDKKLYWGWSSFTTVGRKSSISQTIKRTKLPVCKHPAIEILNNGQNLP